MSTVPDSPPERWDVAAILPGDGPAQAPPSPPASPPDLLGRMIAAWGEGPDPVVVEQVATLDPVGLAASGALLVA